MRAWGTLGQDGMVESRASRWYDGALKGRFQGEVMLLKVTGSTRSSWLRKDLGRRAKVFPSECTWCTCLETLADVLKSFKQVHFGVLVWVKGLADWLD